MKRFQKYYSPQCLKRRKKRLPASAYLAYLVICTLVVGGVSFAKFTQTASGSDNAWVAVFAVDGSGSETDMTAIDCTTRLDPNQLSSDYQFSVTNVENGKTSEVMMDYTVQLKLVDGAQLPKGVTVALTYQDENGHTSSVTGVWDPEKKAYVFDGNFTLPAGTVETDTYTLRLTVDPFTVYEDQNLNMSVTVNAVQID